MPWTFRNSWNQALHKAHTLIRAALPGHFCVSKRSLLGKGSDWLILGHTITPDQSIPGRKPLPLEHGCFQHGHEVEGMAGALVNSRKKWSKVHENGVCS